MYPCPFWIILAAHSSLLEKGQRKFSMSSLVFNWSMRSQKVCRLLNNEMLLIHVPLIAPTPSIVVFLNCSFLVGKDPQCQSSSFCVTIKDYCVTIKDWCFESFFSLLRNHPSYGINISLAKLNGISSQVSMHKIAALCWGWVIFLPSLKPLDKMLVKGQNGCLRCKLEEYIEKKWIKAKPNENNTK